MRALECRSELVVRARRGELSPAEAAALDAHLELCASCRGTRNLGADFDRVAVLQTEDGARIARLSDIAREWALSQQGPPVQAAGRARSSVALALAAACTLLVAAGASGAYAVYQAGRAAELTVAPPTPQPKAAVAVTPKVVVAPAPVAVEAPAPVREAARAAVRETASELLERANRARRAGETEDAISLFRELTQRHSGSAEARLAEVRLGNLLLERGQARAALAEFERHVARGGSLAPEALYGRARALAALGDQVAEHDAWAALVRDYPGSPYVGFAERRRKALAGTAAGNE
jgi:tetratricopeptide (TPR) repeat protein